VCVDITRRNARDCCGRRASSFRALRQAAELIAEVLESPGVRSHWHEPWIDLPTSPLLTTVFVKDDVELRFVSTLTKFSSPFDVVLDELRIECNFPADESTAATCRQRFGTRNQAGAQPQA
jgi:hypothetical protein